MTQVRIGDVTYNLRDWPTPDPAKCSVADLELGTITGSGSMVKLIGMSEGRWNLYGEEFRSRPVEGTASRALLGLRGWFWLTDPEPLKWTAEIEPQHEREVPFESKLTRRKWLSEEFSVGSWKFQVAILEVQEEDESGSWTQYVVHYLGAPYPVKSKAFGCSESLVDAQRLVASQVRELRTRRAQ